MWALACVNFFQWGGFPLVYFKCLLRLGSKKDIMVTPPPPPGLLLWIVDIGALVSGARVLAATRCTTHSLYEHSGKH